MPHETPAREAAPPPTAAPRSYAKGVARRQEILDRAIEVFADKGAEGTSLRAIAEKIGVSHAALLHYFGSREELLVEVLREGERRHFDPQQKREVVGMMVRAAERNVTVPGFVALYTMLLAGSLEADKQYSREFFSARFARIRDELEQLIRAGQENGHDTAGDRAGSDGGARDRSIRRSSDPMAARTERRHRTKPRAARDDPPALTRHPARPSRENFPRSP